MITNVHLDSSHRFPIVHSTNSTTEIIKLVSNALNLPPNEFYLTQNGKRLPQGMFIATEPNANIYLHLKVFGGKGGFGSMLRAIGAQIEKTTNREACRDLSGRRLRDINEEQRMKSWLEKQQERDEEAATKRAKKIEKLKATPKHEFQDAEYFNARSNLAQTVSDALEEGLKNTVTATSSSSGSSSSPPPNDDNNDQHNAAASGSGVKRKNAKPEKKIKKKIKGAQWLDEGLSSDSDDSDSDSSSASGGEDNTSRSGSIDDSLKDDDIVKKAITA